MPRNSKPYDALSYAEAFTFVLRWEGGFVDDPDDHGGRPNKGVTQAVYNRYRADQGRPGQDVQQITDAEVSDIYHSRYWLVAKCHLLLPSLDPAQFDTAINMGPNRAAKIFQRSVGCADDGIIDPLTLAAMGNCDLGPNDLLEID